MLEVKMIFEDRSTSAISHLIRYAYEEDYVGEHVFNENDVVWFAATNTNLIRVLKKHYSKGYYYIIYIDLVPDNPETWSVYENPRCEIENAKYDNVVVLPIKCIEYYVLNLLVMQFNDEKLLGLINKIEYKQESTKKSLEKYFKELLDKYKSCTHTKESKEYYLQDCVCINCGNEGLSRKEKARALIRLLPIYKKLLSKDTTATGEDIIKVQETLYKEFVERREIYERIGYV